jgi:hypothetical protein
MPMLAHTHSFVRIRSTSLEQQAFESLMLELDASFLLALALGHRWGGSVGVADPRSLEAWHA